MTGGRADAPAGLALACLFLDATPERLSDLAARARAQADALPGLARTLEPHGVLGLADRNLRLAGTEPPAAWAPRVAALRRDDACARLTVERLLDAAAEEDVPLLLLKGSALLLDLYREPGLRSQGDVDVLVRPDRVRAALRAAASAGCLPSPHQLPAWWYRLAHFHVKLHATLPLLKDVEVHWRILSPALGLAVDEDALWARARACTVAGRPARVLADADRFLHHAAHLASHWQGPLPGDLWAFAADLLAHPEPPVRLKWVLDLAADAGRLATTLDPTTLVGLADRWGAGPLLASVLRLLDAPGLLAPAGRAFVEACAGRLPPPPRAGRTTHRAPARPSPVLDLRPRTLMRLPRRAWPSRAAFRRGHGLPAAGTGALLGSLALRPAHALAVLARAGLAGVALAPALAARRLLARRRKRARAAAAAPARVADVAAAFRRLERSAPETCAAPRA